MILHDLTVRFTQDGIKFIGRPLEVKETAKMYSCVGHRIDKDKIMKTECKWYQNRYDYIQFSTYCLDEQLEQAKEMLITKVLDTYADRMEVSAKMHSHFKALRP
jgi:hypothetical protein